MKAEVKFNHETGIVTTTFIGTLTTGEVTNVIDQVISHQDYTPGMSGIYDVTHANLSDIDSDLLEELSLQITRISKGRIGKPKVAIVSEHSLNFGTVMLFKEFYRDRDTELKVFDSYKKAENWLLNI